MKFQDRFRSTASDSRTRKARRWKENQVQDASDDGDYVVTDILDKAARDRRDGTWIEDTAEAQVNSEFQQPGPSHSTGEI